MKILTQADDIVDVWVFRLIDWANEEVMWNRQFYRIIHKQIDTALNLLKQYRPIELVFIVKVSVIHL